jgi:APA family basic amino acid/polyamine antiporter
VLRRKEAGTARPFRVPLYPLVPFVFVCTCAYLFYSSIRHAQSENASLIALAVMASGAVVWLVIRRRL